MDLLDELLAGNDGDDDVPFVPPSAPTPTPVAAPQTDRSPSKGPAFQPVRRGPAPPPQRAPASDASSTERFSGLRIRSRALSSIVVDERLRGVRVVKLPSLRCGCGGRRRSHLLASPLTRLTLASPQRRPNRRLGGGGCSC